MTHKLAAFSDNSGDGDILIALSHTDKVALHKIQGRPIHHCQSLESVCYKLTRSVKKINRIYHTKVSHDSISKDKGRNIPCRRCSWLMCSSSHELYSIYQFRPKLFQIQGTRNNSHSLCRSMDHTPWRI